MTSDRLQPIRHISQNQTHNSQTPRVIGLTGGIGMGKTTISNYLRDVHHLPVLDSDIYARDVVKPGSQVLAEIVERYGSRILHADGSLNREQLGDIVFNSPPEKLWLEQRIHPYVRDRLTTELHHLQQDEADYPAIVMVIPLLFEARMTDLVTEIWVVTCPQEQQVQRLLKRENNVRGNALTLEQIHARINGQMAIDKKLHQADVVLHNDASTDKLYAQIDRALGTTPQVIQKPGSNSGYPAIPEHLLQTRE
jgi:dephospho-CoA kinase